MLDIVPEQRDKLLVHDRAIFSVLLEPYEAASIRIVIGVQTIRKNMPF